jgi:hypothetical protein
MFPIIVSNMEDDSMMVLLVFVAILVIVIVALIFILRPSNVRRCIESEVVVANTDSLETNTPGSSKSTCQKTKVNRFKNYVSEKSTNIIIVVCIVCAILLFIGGLFVLHDGVQETLTLLAKDTYKLSIKVYKSVVKYMFHLGGSVSGLPVGLKTLYFYVFLAGALIVVILYGVLLIKDLAFEKLTPFVGDSKIIQGWLVAAMLTIILMVILVFVTMMGYLEKNSNSQKLVIKANILLLCFLITCVTIVMEGKSVEDAFKEDNTYYDKYYTDGKKDPSFIVHACLTLFGVLVFFVSLYSFVIHGSLLEDCNNLYKPEEWTMYTTGKVNEGKLETNEIQQKCYLKQIDLINIILKTKIQSPEAEKMVTDTPPTTPPGADATTQPGDATKPPGDTTTPPGDATTPPGDATTPPGDATTPPRDATTPPGDATTPPGDATKPTVNI